MPGPEMFANWKMWWSMPQSWQLKTWYPPILFPYPLAPAKADSLHSPKPKNLLKKIIYVICFKSPRGIFRGQHKLQDDIVRIFINSLKNTACIHWIGTIHRWPRFVRSKYLIPKSKSFRKFSATELIPVFATHNVVSQVLFAKLSVFSSPIDAMSLL